MGIQRSWSGPAAALGGFKTAAPRTRGATALIARRAGRDI